MPFSIVATLLALVVSRALELALEKPCRSFDRCFGWMQRHRTPFRGQRSNPEMLLRWYSEWSCSPEQQRHSSPANNAALPPAAAVLIVTVCSVAKRTR
jgi:hypothetical protein